METPIVHPHVFQNRLIDLGHSDLATISQPLDALIKGVISIIQYETLRFEFPANLDARDWAERNKHLFPLSTGSDSHQSKPKLNWR